MPLTGPQYRNSTEDAPRGWVVNPLATVYRQAVIARYTSGALQGYADNVGASQNMAVLGVADQNGGVQPTGHTLTMSAEVVALEIILPLTIPGGITTANRSAVIFGVDSNTGSLNPNDGIPVGMLMEVIDATHGKVGIGPTFVARALAAATASASPGTTTTTARGALTNLGGAVTYANGVITGPANTAFPVQDGIASPAIDDVYFAPKGLTNLPAAAQAGPWVVTGLGSGSSVYTLARPAGYATGSTIPTEYTIKLGPEGSSYKNSPWTATCTPGGIVDTVDPLFQLGLGGNTVGGSATGLVGGTTRTQTGATPLTAGVNVVTTATAPAVGTILGDGFQLALSIPNREQVVYNATSYPVQVYPLVADTGATINGVAASVGVTIQPGDMATFMCAAAGVWLFEGGYGCSGPLPTVVSCNGFVAGGTTQATAPVIPGALITVGTCAAGAGFALPVSAPGLSLEIVFACANPCLVYANLSDTGATINGSPGANGLLFHPGDVAVFTCTATGAWNVQPSSPRGVAYGTAANTSAFTALASQITGSPTAVDLALTGALGAAANLTLPSLASLLTAMHSPVAGSAYRLRIINQAAGYTWTVLTGGTGWTLTGTMTIPTATWRDFDVTLNSLSSVTIQSVTGGAYS